MHQFIDHTLLKADATLEQIENLCNEAKKYQFKSVCVQPSYVAAAKKFLAGSQVEVCTVIGFPLGASSSRTKAFETEDAVKNGATEIDMVMNISALKNKDYEQLQNDIEAVVKSAKGKVVKVILETCLLNEEEIIKASKTAIMAGADFIKTSTGFSHGGATIETVKTMLKVADDKVLVKASGGVRSYEDAKSYINLGVKRLGTSSGVAIMAGKVSEESY